MKITKARNSCGRQWKCILDKEKIHFQFNIILIYRYVCQSVAIIKKDKSHFPGLRTCTVTVHYFDLYIHFVAECATFELNIFILVG